MFQTFGSDVLTARDPDFSTSTINLDRKLSEKGSKRSTCTVGSPALIIRYVFGDFQLSGVSGTARFQGRQQRYHKPLPATPELKKSYLYPFFFFWGGGRRRGHCSSPTQKECFPTTCREPVSFWDAFLGLTVGTQKCMSSFSIKTFGTRTTKNILG